VKKRRLISKDFQRAKSELMRTRATVPQKVLHLMSQFFEIILHERLAPTSGWPTIQELVAQVKTGSHPIGLRGDHLGG
jgi:hypothetical protein